MTEYVLVKGEVAGVVRKDHYGDPRYWLVDNPEIPYGSLRYVRADECIPLDPALNILFERKDDGQERV